MTREEKLTLPILILQAARLGNIVLVEVQIDLKTWKVHIFKGIL